jgi:hypothetical protein
MLVAGCFDPPNSLTVTNSVGNTPVRNSSMNFSRDPRRRAPKGQLPHVYSALDPLLGRTKPGEEGNKPQGGFPST